jgi:hypothetical protein
VVEFDARGDGTGAAEGRLALAEPEDRIRIPEGRQVQFGDGGDECLTPSGISASAAAARLCLSISFSASSKACSVLASWAFSSVGEDIVAWDEEGKYYI